jgi:Outer membrane protein transport protein (OMPP1/FadL/TodX)
VTRLAVNRRVICAMVALAPAQAHADGLSVVGGSPRAIGRAGAATVGDDGGGALLVNPAAMARRDTARGQVGLAMVDDALVWQSDTSAAPLSKGQAPAQLAPLGAAIGAIGDWILGGGIMTSGVTDRALPQPSGATDGFFGYFDYRYAGIAGSYRRDTLALGIARRVGDSLAFGLSLGASQVRVTEQRRIWAGFGGRDSIGGPSFDVDLTFHASDRFAASAVAGVLYAPGDTKIELGASVAWADTVNLDGTLTGDTTPGRGPRVEYPYAPRATLQVPQPLAVRGGGRYVGDRFVAELDGDLWLLSPSAESTTWWVHGVRVIDSSDFPADLQRVPSRISQCTHAAVHGAVDVELMPGFLWATGGYAYSSRGTPAERLSPTFADLGGHTLGLGLETSSGGFTVTFGWSRTWSLSANVPSQLQLDNPFAAGDGPVLSGKYGGSFDQIGILIEAELTPSDLPK